MEGFFSEALYSAPVSPLSPPSTPILGQPLLIEKYGRKKRERKNAINSGNYVLPATLKGCTHLYAQTKMFKFGLDGKNDNHFDLSWPQICVHVFLPLFAHECSDCITMLRMV